MTNKKAADWKAYQYKSEQPTTNTLGQDFDGYKDIKLTVDRWICDIGDGHEQENATIVKDDGNVVCGLIVLPVIPRRRANAHE